MIFAKYISHNIFHICRKTHHSAKFYFDAYHLLNFENIYVKTVFLFNSIHFLPLKKVSPFTHFTKPEKPVCYGEEKEPFAKTISRGVEKKTQYNFSEITL